MGDEDPNLENMLYSKGEKRLNDGILGLYLVLILASSKDYTNSR